MKKTRNTPLSSPEASWINLQIEKAHGQVLAFAKIAGYLQARIEIDRINGHNPLAA